MIYDILGSLNYDQMNTNFRRALDCFVLNPACLVALDTYDTCGWRLRSDMVLFNSYAILYCTVGRCDSISIHHHRLRTNFICAEIILQYCMCIAYPLLSSLLSPPLNIIISSLSYPLIPSHHINTALFHMCTTAVRDHLLTSIMHGNIERACSCES